eukprot:CAMPEP_0198328646 /NCGR_PEP_ID=MMETSP1450-20131203/15603_1 /TAXON_ID=753684 ORGANISM="Madagascaria erythrocladiodes, Strain CCMP3234" /NCGR_SAMPLE_ID=MMETSP1450 /ASSEMBLY_ACC=CAM_ASM_001115 /LENGTH=214 /DNA_ID=CAMNT_0044032793 /DNA_START=919 /DNA_END=1561 /DNA_ORIENTATION=+
MSSEPGQHKRERGAGAQAHKRDSVLSAILTICASDTSLSGIVVRLIDEAGEIITVGADGGDRSRRAHCFFGPQNGRYAVILEDSGGVAANDADGASQRGAGCAVNGPGDRAESVFKKSNVVLQGKRRPQAASNPDPRQRRLRLAVKDLRVGVTSRAGDDHATNAALCRGTAPIWRVGEILFEKRRRARWVNRCNLTFSAAYQYLAVAMRSRNHP